jgi:hypothetical protein
MPYLARFRPSFWWGMMGRSAYTAVLLFAVAVFVHNGTANARQPRDTTTNSQPGLPQQVWHDGKIAVSDLYHDFLYIYTSPARLRRSEALKLAGILAAGGVLMANDEEILSAVQRNAESWPLRPLIMLGYETEHQALKAVNTKYFAWAMIFGYLFEWETVTQISADVLECYLISGPFTQAAWRLAGRKRPQDNVGAYDFTLNGGESFFSGHTLNAWIIARAISRRVEFWPADLAAYTVATSITMQRLDDDRHWPSDVFTGAIIAVALTDGVINHKLARANTRLQPALLGPNGTPAASLTIRF